MSTDYQQPQDKSHVRVLSYARCASGTQANSDSIERQIRLARKWCMDEGYTLHESDELVDNGVSAFSIASQKGSKLAALQEKLLSGEVACGSILIVESLDRITRYESRAPTSLLSSLVNAGLVIVTLCNGQIWDQTAMAGYVKSTSKNLC